MFRDKFKIARWVILPLMALLFTLALNTGGVFARVFTEVPTGGQANALAISGIDLRIAPTIPDSKSSPDYQQDAFMVIQPGTGGTCAAPANGGTVAFGCRFVFDLMLNAGTNADPEGASVQQSYLTFTHQVVNVARVSVIATTCTVTNTLTADLTEFDQVLQNEVCNSQPGGCVFRGQAVPNGYMAFASGSQSPCPNGCPNADFPDPVWRVAQIGVCAVGGGQALFHWQFNPPDPTTRDSQILEPNNGRLSNRALYTDYTFTVTGGSTNTPTSTAVAATNTSTSTPVPPTNTSTNTPVPPTNTSTVTRTNTAVPPTNTSTNTPVPATNTST